MKHLKMFGAVALAAISLAAWGGAGSASATALYNGTTKLGVGSKIDFSLKSGFRGTQTETSGRVLDECGTTTIKGTISAAGGSGSEVQGTTETLEQSNCTVPTVTDVKGGMKIAQIGTSTEATVRANSEVGITINTIFFGACRYGVSSGTHLGVLKSSASGTAEIVTNAVATKQTGSEFACPETSKWTGTYVSTEPDNLRVEAS
jgi:hypothetical protein